MTPTGSATRSDVPGVILPPPLIYLACLVVGIIADQAWPWSFGMPELWRLVIGAVIGIAGLGLGIAAIATFQRAGTNVQTRLPTTALATDGPYRWSRNPIYVGFTLLTLGIGMTTDAPAVWVAMVPTLIVIELGVIRREERYLEAKFGERYRSYRNRVRRWL